MTGGGQKMSGYKYKVDGVTFDVSTIDANFKQIRVYTWLFPMGCFWMTNNQSEYLKRKILNKCCLKDILNVCTILDKCNNDWEYFKTIAFRNS